jgi:hypothetical protein
VPGDTNWINLSIFNLTGANTVIPAISSNMVLFKVCRGISARVAIVNLPTMMHYLK